MPAKFPFGTSVYQRGDVEVAGNVYFVDSGHASASDVANQGLTPDAPFATIDFAIGQCTANNGDVIYVMPGHNESITSATSLVMDVAGVQVIGLGRGNSRPILDFDNTAGSIEMDAANTRLSNLVLRVSVSACVVGINVDADHVELDHLETTFEATGDDFLIVADIDAVDYAHVHHCVFNTELGATGGTECIRLDDAHYVVIENNRFVGNWTAATILGAGALCQGLIIRNNIIYNEDTSVYCGVDMGTLSTTGIMSHNDITALYATTLAKVFRDGDLTSYDNWFANAVSERGITSIPATTGA